MSLLVPLTLACLMQAARRYHVAPVVLEAIRVVENGETGQARRNANGSFDLGPFQVNSRWIRPLRRRGVRVSFARLRDNGCVNVFVAAWILRSEERRAPGRSLRIAIGRYHSPRKESARRYRARVLREIAEQIRRRTPAALAGQTMNPEIPENGRDK